MADFGGMSILSDKMASLATPRQTRVPPKDGKASTRRIAPVANLFRIV